VRKGESDPLEIPGLVLADQPGMTGHILKSLLETETCRFQAIVHSIPLI
jgi:hypothetical protein